MKDIKDYEGRYAVTEDGQIWSYKRKIFLKPSKSKNGYLKVVLCKEAKTKTFLVHRLVLETYCPVEDMENLQVNHKSEIKTDNSLNNLEWCDAKYNNNYGTRNNRAARANGKTVRCVETNEVFYSLAEAERQTGISRQCIGFCCNGKTKTAGGYHWEFV